MFNKHLVVIKLIVISLVVSCGSSKIKEREHENIKRIYEVRDASANIRPGWIEDAEIWAKENADLDTKKFRFFSYESTVQKERGIACSIAKSKVRAQIAGEISTFIEEKLAEQKEGPSAIDLNAPETSGMRQFVETSLANKTMAMIHGAAIIKKYWEQRKYLKDLGSKLDFIGYTCSVLIRMEQEKLAELIDKAGQLVQAEVADPEIKEKVKNALKDIDENFKNAKTGKI